MWNSLLMKLAPSEASFLELGHTCVGQAGVMRRGRFGGAHLLDAVVEDGVIIHYETVPVDILWPEPCEVRSSLSTCDQSTPDGAADEAACRTLAHHLLQTRSGALGASMPRPWPRLRPIVLGGSASRCSSPSTGRAQAPPFSWSHSRRPGRLPRRPSPIGPKRPQVALLVQVVAWYVVCNGIKFTGCHRPPLIDLPQTTVEQMFAEEMAARRADPPENGPERRLCCSRCRASAALEAVRACVAAWWPRTPSRMRAHH